VVRKPFPIAFDERDTEDLLAVDGLIGRLPLDKIARIEARALQLRLDLGLLKVNLTLHKPEREPLQKN
jgi:hypothetical protein